MLLYAGPLQMLYDRGFLRYISYRDSEILRMIYFAVRDEHWKTCDHEIRNEHRDISWETFRIEYDCYHSLNGEQLMKWHTVIEGRPNCSVTFTIQGEVLHDHLKNRAGFCILHPIEPLAGTTAQLTHADGKISTSNFPVLVAADNPFKNIQKLRWTRDSREFELSFEGDIFETEDQRNWTDASYKTFCTPSNLPIPVKMKKGAKVWQRISFKPIEHLPPIPTPSRVIVQLEKSEQASRLPLIGTGHSTNAQLNNFALKNLQSLNLDHYRVDVMPSKENWVSDFSFACEQSTALNLPLEIVLHLTERFEEEIQKLAMLIHQNRLRVKYLLLVTVGKPVTDPRVVAWVPAIKKQIPNVAVGAGTDEHFKDINRNHIVTQDVDFVSFAIHPQVHQCDDLTLIENIGGQYYAVNSAREKYRGTSVHVSPVTLGSRKNRKDDPRYKTDFAKVWTFGSLLNLAKAGAEAATIFETIGASGLVSEESTYPVFDLLKEILPYRGAEMITLETSHPLWVSACIFKKGNHQTLWLANYTDDLQTAQLGRQEFQLQPYSVQHFNLNSP